MECRTEKSQGHRLADGVTGQGHTGHCGWEPKCPTVQGIRSGRDSCENPAPCPTLGSKPQAQLPAGLLSAFPPSPPALPRRNSEKTNVKDMKGAQELRVRPGRHPLLTLCDLTSICS